LKISALAGPARAATIEAKEARRCRTRTWRPNVEYGNPEVALGGEVLRSVVGSGVHGIAIEGTDDHDEMDVRVTITAIRGDCAAAAVPTLAP